MGSFAVIYVKIVDNKKEGIIVNGPVVSDIKETEEEAKLEAKRLVAEARNSTIIPKIYQLNNITDLETTVNESKLYFKSMHENMIEAKEALSRPVHRRKRRKMKAAASED